ncbi:hypothetical protein C8R47DRAFT_1231457 [Mycena vitilis]|nr:hypothetical protein C8R47DRAFT_1231457 [Mycena vitilis]
MPNHESGFFELLIKLPHEILSLVLLCTVRRDRLDPNPEALWRRTLCLVCKRWWETLYNTPQAWTRLSFTFASNTTIPTLIAALNNSRGALKDVEIAIHKNRRVHATHTPAESNEMTAFIHHSFMLLDQHFPRIRVFRIICPEFAASELALAYLARMDCRRLTDMYIVLRLNSNPLTIRKRPTFASSFPVLNMLYTAKCLPPATLNFTGRTVTDVSTELGCRITAT